MGDVDWVYLLCIKIAVLFFFLGLLLVVYRYPGLESHE